MNQVLHPFLGERRPNDIAGQAFHCRIVVGRYAVAAKDVEPGMFPCREHPHHLLRDLPLAPCTFLLCSPLVIATKYVLHYPRRKDVVDQKFLSNIEYSVVRIARHPNYGTLAKRHLSDTIYPHCGGTGKNKENILTLFVDVVRHNHTDGDSYHYYGGALLTKVFHCNDLFNRYIVDGGVGYPRQAVCSKQYLHNYLLSHIAG